MSSLKLFLKDGNLTKFLGAGSPQSNSQLVKFNPDIQKPPVNKNVGSINLWFLLEGSIISRIYPVYIATIYVGTVLKFKNRLIFISLLNPTSTVPYAFALYNLLIICLLESDKLLIDNK